MQGRHMGLSFQHFKLGDGSFTKMAVYHMCRGLSLVSRRAHEGLWIFSAKSSPLGPC